MAGTRQFCEQDVFEQVLLVFREKGYRGTSMIDLAKATGVQRGSLYNAYQTKTNLFVKAFGSYSEAFFKMVNQLLEHPDAKTAFTQLLGGLSDQLMKSNGNYGCLSTRTIVDIARDSPEIQHYLIQFLDQIEDIVAKRLEKAQQEGQFSGDCQATARYIVALTRGIAVIERAYGDANRLEEIYSTAIEGLPFT